MRQTQGARSRGSLEERFAFRGGIVLISNRALANLPELRALATRIAVYRLEVSESELVAVLHQIAAQGYRRDGKLVLPPEACAEVARHLLGQCRQAQCPLDLRLLFNSYHDYLLWESDRTGCHWRDLVAVRARETATNLASELETLSPEEKRRQRRQVLREIIEATADPGEQERLYRARTGKSRADFFRRKREVDSGEFDGEAAD